LRQHGIVFVAALDDVIALDGDEVGLDSGDRSGAPVDGLGQLGGVAGAGELDDGYGAHIIFVF
jgi:hypothetical protein